MADRDRILQAALPHIAFDGWSKKALQAGAEDIGLDPAEAVRAFPGRATDMIAHHSRMADRLLAEELEELDLAEMRIRDRIAAAVRIRLEANAEHREAIRRAITILALPVNAGLSMRLTYRTVDTMWRAAGDTATDWNFYTKRILLAGVYGSTVLFWLNDESKGFAETWGFLDRRIADVLRVPRATQRLSRLFDCIPNPFSAVIGRANHGNTRRPPCAS
ncbi:MAG: COQ9 family protein [Alphaproteobacteria bacterium]|nr:COQ9 family protein [Alphaproteobacteria bacterium]